MSGTPPLVTELVRAKDQDLADLRKVYEALGLTDKIRICDWLKEVERIEVPPHMVGATVFLVLRFYVGNPPREIKVSADTMLRAIECWDKGEGYVPNMDDL